MQISFPKLCVNFKIYLSNAVPLIAGNMATCIPFIFLKIFIVCGELDLFVKMHSWSSLLTHPRWITFRRLWIKFMNRIPPWQGPLHCVKKMENAVLSLIFFVPPFRINCDIFPGFQSQGESLAFLLVWIP